MAIKFWLIVLCLPAAAAWAQSSEQSDAAGLYSDGLRFIMDGEFTQGYAPVEVAANDFSNVDAMWTLAVLEHVGLGKKADFSKAAEWAKKASEGGSAIGARIYGYLWLKGQGVHSRDPAKALEYFEQAAKANDAQGMYMLARVLEGGAPGVDRDVQTAMSWYEKAAAVGYPFAKWRLGELLISESSDARRKARGVALLEEASAQGVPSAHFAYGRQLFHGEGVVQNYNTAFRHFLYAANLGHAGAQNMAGYLLIKELVAPEYLESMLTDGYLSEWQLKNVRAAAIRLLRRSAAQDHPAALHNLAEVYRSEGQYVQAHRYFNLASSRGVEPAVAARNEMQERLTAGELQKAQELATDQAMASSERDKELKKTGSGSGFFISLGGAIATNHHVIDGCDHIEVAIGQKIRDARIMFARRDVDLAVLQIERKEGERIDYGVARLVEQIFVGDRVGVFGWPYSEVLSPQGSFTMGTLSASQGVYGDDRFIQISAPVSPGNSGGPVLAESGWVIGVVRSQLGLERQQNINFAIKVGELTRILSNYQQAFYIAPEGQQEPLLGRELHQRAKRISAFIQCYKRDFSQNGDG